MVEQTQEPQQQRDGWQDVGWHRLGKDDAGNDELESQPADKQETIAKKLLLLEEKKDWTVEPEGTTSTRQRPLIPVKIITSKWVFFPT